MSRKNKYILYLALLNGLLASLLISFGKVIFEDARTMLGITFALVMFCIYELFVIFFTESKSEKLNSRQQLSLFLGFKTGKIFLSLLFITVYAIVINIELKRFIGVFLVLYLIFLLFDTVYLTTREKNLKKKEKQYKLEEIEKLSNFYKK